MALCTRWRFEPGTFLNDSSGNGNTLTNGTAYPSVVTSWRMEGQGSCYFHSTPMQWLTIADASLSAGFPLRGTDATPVTTFTFAFWFMAADTGTGRVLFKKGGGATRTIQVSYGSTQVMNLTLWSSAAGATAHSRNHATALSASTPYFVASGFDFTTKDSFTRIRDRFANTVGTDRVTTETLTDGVLFTNTEGLEVGGSVSASRMYGHLDDFRVFDTALTAAQVTQLCRQSSGRAGKRLMMGG